MLNKNFLIISIITIFLAIGTITNAQENPTEKNDTKMVKQYDDPQKCMDKIAADSTMRMQMMAKMMDQCKGDKEGMMQMCKTMMNNPEMHKMMMDEAGKMKNHDIKSDSIKTIQKEKIQ